MAINRSFPGAIISNWRIKALSLLAAIMLFIFNSFSGLSERFISVELHTTFAEGMTSAQPYPRRVRVEIRGKDRSLAAATEEDIEAFADFSRFTEAGLSTTPVAIRKRGVLEGVDAIEIQVEPLEITLPIETKIRKRTEVIPVFKGLPATGYRLGQYSVNPAGVDVEGPLSIVQTVNSVSSEDIDLADKREAFTLRVRLVKENPLLTFPGGDTVDFRAQIQEASEQRTFDGIGLTLQGLSPLLRLSGETPEGWITVQGGQSFFEAQKKEDFQLVVSCISVVEVGTHILPVKPVIPQGLSVLQFSPAQLTLVIHRGGRVEIHQ